MTTIFGVDSPSGRLPSSIWRRVRFVLIATTLICLPVSMLWDSKLHLWTRAITLGFMALLMFSIFERWPRQLPRWLARWVLQVVMVGLAMPLTTLAIYKATEMFGALPTFSNESRMNGFMTLTFLSTLLAPWISLAALIRQKDALARHQALEFDLERSELARQASDARLHLLQAQVAPHFLFNTLANIQALVDAGSPRASTVLRSLVAYLRAAVPRLHEVGTRLGNELEMVQAYLELMYMRMPDRLEFAIDADESVKILACPPMALMTLVENAVSHGIDPSEEGGRIDVMVRREGDLCIVRVSDTGVGLRHGGKGLGTGLATLRERLRLNFGDNAALRISAVQPHGVCVELEFPARDVEE
ncbi:histidine kinase [Chromobacterium amazonense]|uniref:sensor histidine kinase n=1 Tax=Chromobacterium amazonense TaxID=1382803 RepID=UPI00237ED38C|nr:histidine kinase [Chromobacterium amazonense]MDE1715568.1 histidine kinase [Chromobacterium amazonense]